MQKGVIINYLCRNPSCSNSQNKIEVKSPLRSSGTNATFNTIKSCPKCKSSIEMLNFVSGIVEITPDEIDTKRKKEE